MTYLFLSVVLIAPALDLDVQALGAREVLQGTKKYLLLPQYIVKKIDLSISN
jgi:hypothetical protein